MHQFFKVIAPIVVIFMLVMACSVPPQESYTELTSLPEIQAEKYQDEVLRVDDFLNTISPQLFTGTVLLEKNGNILYAKGYGNAIKESRLPFTPETVFPIGPLTKLFTAAAILKLESQGVLQVADSLGKFIKDLPADKQQITVHQLLTHTSGLPYELTDSYTELSKKNFLKNLTGAKLAFAPGSDFLYSDVGYITLAAVVEEASGMDFEKYLQEYLFIPSEMLFTGYLRPDWKDVTLAEPYQEAWGQPLDKLKNIKNDNWNLLGASGMLSTPRDLYRWQKVLQKNRILTKDAKQKYFSAYVDLYGNGTAHYTYGWVLDKGEGRKLLLSEGANGPFYLIFRWYPDEESMVLILASQKNSQVQQLGRQLARVLFNESYIPVVQPTKLETFKRVPESGQGTLLRNFIDAYNTGKKENIQAFLEGNYVGEPKANKKYRIQQLTDLFNKVYKQLGVVELVNVEQAGQDFFVKVKSIETPQQLLLQFSLINPLDPKIKKVKIETFDFE